MTEQRMIAPPANELSALAAELATEVDELLSSPRWQLLRTSSKVAHHVYAAAGLRHTIALLNDVVDAVERWSEAALRVLGRAHLEAFLVGMYVTVYGDEALDDIKVGYSRAISSQHSRLAEYDEVLRRETARVRGRNRRIRAQNRDLERWNEAHPEKPSKALKAEVPMPLRTAVGLDLAAALVDIAPDNDEVSPLALAGIVARLNKYGRAEEGPDALFDMVYDLGYRGLSTLGAHPTLWVLNAYVDNSKPRMTVATVPEMRATSMAEPVLSTAVLLTAALVQKVIGLKGDEAPTAAKVSARYQTVR